MDKLDVLRSKDSVRIGVPVFIRMKESYRMSTKKGIDLKGGRAKVS